MGVSQVRKVIEVWGEQYSELSKVPWISYVQIFENCGAMMGCSNPHPHCQIWASESVPNEAEKEQRSFSRYLRKNGGCLLCRYAELELQNRERVLVENEKFVALVPFWAIWPFEVLVVSKKHLESMELLSREDREGLAEILKKVTIRYDNLFRTAFPYSMGFHQAPTDGASHPEWHFHAHFYPPLLRSATVKKFMVGYEMLGTPQRDITAESAAARLRDLPEIHYLERNQTV
jgi:UDPglucose--hexose-1-phosphate uridylyltransferase